MYRRVPRNYDNLILKLRNYIDIAIVDGLLALALYSLHIAFKYKMYIAVLMVPLTIFLYMGISNHSVSEHLIYMLKFYSKRRVLEKPDAKYTKEKDKAILKDSRKKRKQIKQERSSRNEK